MTLKYKKMKKTKHSLKKYCEPKIERIKLDNEISLALSSIDSPPEFESFNNSNIKTFHSVSIS